MCNLRAFYHIFSVRGYPLLLLLLGDGAEPMEGPLLPSPNLARENPPSCYPHSKILKLMIYLFLDFLLRIWFQKYYINPLAFKF